jgi:hypothetical protein
VTTASEREQACSRFEEDYSIAYARMTEIGGRRVLVMFDGDGDALAVSEHGVGDLKQYAAEFGIELLAVH